MITKGIIIFTIGIIGTIVTLILWLISIFRTPDDIKTYFIYDDSGDINMINKTIRANESTSKENSDTEIDLYEYRTEQINKRKENSIKNEKIYKTKVNNLIIDETKIDNEYLEIDETKIDNNYLEIDETKIDNNYLDIDETKFDSRFNDIN